MEIKQQPQTISQLVRMRWPSLGVALALAFGVATIGGLATGRSVLTWYPTLKKPRWNPPNWLFAPVWNLLFLLMGIASWQVWQVGEGRHDGAPLHHAHSGKQAKAALTLYGMQLALNALWSVLFFGMRRIDLALIEVVPLWGAILATIGSFYRVRPVAALLLIPYQLWVTFAAVLNLRLWQLNRR